MPPANHSFVASIGPTSSRWNRIGLAFLLLTLALLALEVWGIRSSVGALFR
jgi:hypothetical protein